MIIPMNKKVLILPGIVSDMDTDSVLARVKIKKDTLLKGVVENSDFLPIGTVVYFPAFGYEQIGKYVIVDEEQIYARETNSQN